VSRIERRMKVVHLAHCLLIIGLRELYNRSWSFNNITSSFWSIKQYESWARIWSFCSFSSM